MPAHSDRVTCHRLELQPRTLPHALPGDRPQWPRDREAAVRHIALDLVLDVPARRVTGTATLTLEAINDGLADLHLDAVELAVSAVAVDGAPARFVNDGESLRVHLPAPAARGHAFDVEVTYSAAPRIGLYFVGPDAAYPEKPVQVWSQGQDEDNRHWFPCYDYPAQKQTTELRVTVPGEWYALSNGRLLSDSANDGGTRTFHWRQDRPHSTYLVTLVAGEFTRIDASRPDLTIDYFVEPGAGDAAERTFGDTPAMIALFEELTGVPFPWAKYSQVVVRDFVFGGMENTSATTLTENILLDARATRDFRAHYLVSHELAHMWYGDLLTCRDWSHGWLNESFATYFEMLWDERRFGVDEYRQGVIENTEAYLEERYRRPIVTNVFHTPMDIFDRHLYEKGSVVLHMLRGLLGDDAFFRSIRRYTREHQDRAVITQDLQAAIEAETGRNLDWFFDQWVFRPGHPELEVSWSWDGGAKLATVSVRQTQKADGDTPVYRLPVTVDFTAGRGKPRAFAVEVTETAHTFVFPLPAKPDLCRFDPGNFVLKTLKFDKSVGELILQLRADDGIAGRISAAKALGTKAGPGAVEALEDAVMRDRFWSVQAAAAKALGAMRTDAARDALLRCLRVRNPKARRGVVAGLGEYRGDEAVFAALAPIAGRDQSWFVEAEANHSIGKLRVPGALGLLARNLGRPSWRELVRSGCADGLAALRAEEGLDLLFAEAAYGARLPFRHNVVAAIGRLGEHFPMRKRDTGERLAALLRDPDLRVRITAAAALRQVGDESQVPALEAMAGRELDGRAIRMAREAAHELRKGANTEGEVRNLRNELDQLRDDNTRLRDRLAKLEARTG